MRDFETPPILTKLIKLLGKEMVDSEPFGKDGLDVTYADGERVRFTVQQLDRPKSEVVH